MENILTTFRTFFQPVFLIFHYPKSRSTDLHTCSSTVVLWNTVFSAFGSLANSLNLSSSYFFVLNLLDHRCWILIWIKLILFNFCIISTIGRTWIILALWSEALFSYVWSLNRRRDLLNLLSSIRFSKSIFCKPFLGSIHPLYFNTVD